jgi:erythromycin esterase
MGFHLKKEYPDELFTIALYMLRGETADNRRNTVGVLPPRDNSLEAIAYSARLAALYFSTSGDQAQVLGNSFIFERTDAHYWGGEFGAYSIIPKDHFDGVIVIDKASIPNYR